MKAVYRELVDQAESTDAAFNSSLETEMIKFKKTIK
jgi:hypothetical protein